MAGRTLPTELLAGVFGHLSPSYLAVSSRVCHNWKKAAFPLLYRTVYLCLTTHLEQFAQRILTEDEGDPYAITNHLKGLVFDIEYLKNRQEEMIGESDLDRLNAIIPRLTHLSYLSWNLMFVPEDPETFRLFQTQCPKLDSVHIWIKEVDFYSDEYDTLFEFKDLSHFSLSIRDMPPMFDEDLLDPLTSLLGRCPQLYSIMLDIQHGEFKYSPAALVAALGDGFVFPRLRRFHARGAEDPDWMGFFEDPESHPLRQFFNRHPGIEDLALGYVDESAFRRYIDPAEISQLFPSLKHFEGPVFLFKPVVLSTLANQIETLIIVDDPLRDDISLSEMYDRIPTLPKLRKFGIWADEIKEGVLIKMLRTIVNAASRLEEIEIHLDIDDTIHGDIMASITRVRGLRSITLDESILSTGDDGEELEWDTFASTLNQTCPRLQTIYQPIAKFDKENREKVWEAHNA